MFAPEVVAVEGARFSPVNALGGACIGDGLKGFASMFANHNESEWGIRQTKHRSSAPTDNQAEALVPGLVSIAHLREVIVQKRPIADELLRHDGFEGLQGVKLAAVPQMFNKSLASSVRAGGIPIFSDSTSGRVASAHGCSSGFLARSTLARQRAARDL